jgi:hypothetical protein
MMWLAFLLQTAAVPLPAAQDATARGATLTPASTPTPTPTPTPVETRTDGSQRWSIMSCPKGAPSSDILVCGNRDALAFEGPAAGRGANRDMSAANALALQSTPCAARVGGCQVGFNVLGPPTMLVRIIQKLVKPSSDCCEGGDATNPLSLVRDVAKGVKGAAAGKVDKSNRVAIPLDDPAPVAGAIATPAAPKPVDGEPSVPSASPSGS